MRVLTTLSEWGEAPGERVEAALRPGLHLEVADHDHPVQGVRDDAFHAKSWDVAVVLRTVFSTT